MNTLQACLRVLGYLGYGISFAFFFYSAGCVRSPAAVEGPPEVATAHDSDTQAWSTLVIDAPRLSHQRLYSDAAKAEIGFHIFKPRLYDSQKQRHFPVLYWLHGRSGVPEQLGHLVDYFDKSINQHKILPMLVVFPSGMPENMWVDAKDGKTPMETIVIQELIPYIDANYRTIAARQGRIIEGFSMGGYGAARFGFKYPHMFSGISMLGAGPLQKELTEFGASGMALVRKRTMERIYGNDQGFFIENSPWLLAERNVNIIRRNNPEIRIVVGADDRMLENNQALSKHLDDLQIRHQLIVPPNIGHNPGQLIKALGPSNWSFYRTVFANIGHQSRAQR